MRSIRRTIIDVHAHIIPTVDDGAGSLSEACAMLKQAASQGITAVIATPHYSRRQGADRLPELVKQLQEHIRDSLPGFCVYLGQETYYNEALTEHLKSGKALSLAGSRYVLVEFEPKVSYQTLFRGIRKLLQAGYVPVLAHMERYRCLRQEEMLEDLDGSGCIFQMNYESLEGSHWNREARWCRKQVRLGRIQLLGTDMHRLDYRPPKIDAAWKWLENHIEQELLADMCYENPMRIIRDEKIR